jgi:hypothetical protein
MTSKVAIKDPEFHLLASNLALYQTPKGYQNSSSMGFYVRKILVPYCENLRNVTHEPIPPLFLIMDNCLFHNKQALLALYSQSNIRVIWLPQHSSHFRQPLDLGLFVRRIGRPISKVQQEADEGPVASQRPAN